jgi:tetratricopeptide (TPR) repeat protein
MLDEKDIALLEAYTYGEISPEAETSLRERLAGDTDFAASVRRWELLEREGFVVEPTEATRAAVTAALEKPTDLPVRKPWWRYLFGFLLLSGMAFVGWQLSQEPSSAPASAPPAELPAESTESAQDNIYADLVDEYFRHLPSENFHLGSEETLEERALAAYEARDYAKALPLLLETVEMGGDSLNLLYAGVAALGLGDGEKAISAFAGVLANDELKGFHEDATFLQVLGLIRAGQLEKAERVIEDNALKGKYPYLELKNKIDAE